MRLIDADVTVTVMLYDDEHEEHYTEKMTIEEALDLLTEEGCPNPADRPQGEWVDKGKNLWKCSNCEMVIYSESEQDRNEFHKWCSRCGARMLVKSDENHK